MGDTITATYADDVKYIDSRTGELTEDTPEEYFQAKLYGARAVSYTHLDVYKRQVDHISLCSTAEAEEIVLIQLQARMPVIVERAASHTVSVDFQPEMCIRDSRYPAHFYRLCPRVFRPQIKEIQRQHN